MNTQEGRGNDVMVGCIEHMLFRAKCQQAQTVFSSTVRDEKDLRAIRQCAVRPRYSYDL